MIDPKTELTLIDTTINSESVSNGLQDAQDAITIVNNQLKMVASTIETSSSDAIVRFVKVVNDIEGAIKLTNNIVDDVQNKLLSDVSKDVTVDKENVDNAIIRQRYETKVHEISNELTLIAKRKSENIEKMNEIRDQVKTTLLYSKNIENIARGTKILAINASVEAAQAGEYGRTFAVVADAIQTVAQQSHNTAIEIIDQMNLMDQSIEGNVNLIKDAINIESRCIDSTIVIINDVFLSLIDSIFLLSHNIHNIVETTFGDSSQIKQEVASIIVDLQFQDMTKQISEHIVKILEDVKTDISRSDQDNNLSYMDKTASKVNLLQRFNNVATTYAEKNIAKTTLDALSKQSTIHSAIHPNSRISAQPKETGASNDSDITFF